MVANGYYFLNRTLILPRARKPDKTVRFTYRAGERDIVYGYDAVSRPCAITPLCLTVESEQLRIRLYSGCLRIHLFWQFWRLWSVIFTAMKQTMKTRYVVTTKVVIT
jgi:hypothetical protein